MTSQPPEGLARNSISLRINKIARIIVGNRNERNRQPRISKNGIITDRVRVSASPVQGKPSNQDVIPEGSPNKTPRREAPRANLKKKTGEFSLLGCILKEVRHILIRLFQSRLVDFLFYLIALVVLAVFIFGFLERRGNLDLKINSPILRVLYTFTQ